MDDGPGIVAGDIPHAFERFYLYDRLGSERRVGTGLGLAIVHELASSMGGSARVQSEPGVGSTFSIVLPPPRGKVAARENRDASVGRTTAGS